MRDVEGSVSMLTDGDCWQMLRDAPVGRLALSAGSDIDIFPVTFRVDGQSLYFRTSPGLKLAEVGIRSRATLEVDGYDDTTAWSVVAKGSGRHLISLAELDIAAELRLTTWLPTPTPDIVRIDVESLSGRRFSRAS
ncbi:hypothetical protein AX769_21460 (plasmid) [Frondihabitans sp. PAMC 28766]|nr:hypothetical protein AX769_21460 [Frondihabitans sp. PAMC 28766]